MARRILITGAAGQLGTWLRREIGDEFRLRLSDRLPVDDLAEHEEYVGGDLRSADDVRAMTRGVDGVVHLGGIPGESDWQSILEANIEGTYHVFEAARQEGAERIVFASSNHVVGFHPATGTIGTDVPVWPDTRYGVAKAFGESLGALYAHKYGHRVTCLRIGHVLERPTESRHFARWLSPRDLTQLVRIGLDHPEIRYEILYGISDNREAFWDLTRARELGYRPADRAEDHPRPPDDPPESWDRFSGGHYTRKERGGYPPPGPRPGRGRWWRFGRGTRQPRHAS